MDRTLPIPEAGRILSQVPTHLLRAAYLIGKIPFQALVSDPRVSYTLYIPDQYKEIHEAQQQKNVQSLPAPLRLIVNIHGTRRDAVTCRDSLIGFADKHGLAVLAPLFPAGLDSPLDIDNFKNLRSKTLHADLRLLDILTEISHLWPGINTDSVILMGFSGGAQFVHRFAYLYHERLDTIVIAAPGSVTALDRDRKWPAGVHDVGDVFVDQVIGIEGLRQIPAILMIVGEDDGVDVESMELQAFIAGQSGEKVESVAGMSRVDVIKLLHSNWEENGIRADLKTIPSVGHDYTALMPSILSWLDKCVANSSG